MKSILILAIFLFQIVCYAEDSAWQASRSKPIANLNISSFEQLTKVENQISCEHLSFRYKELSKILEDIAWLFSKPSNDKKIEAHNYIMNRLQADPRMIAGQGAFKVHFQLSGSLLKQDSNPVEAIAILGATNFDLLFPSANTGSSSSIVGSNLDLEVATDVNAYDICTKKYLEVFLLRGCPKNETDKFICGDNLCPASLTYDWQACASVEAVKVDISSLVKKLGLRTREIRRKL